MKAAIKKGIFESKASYERRVSELNAVARAAANAAVSSYERGGRSYGQAYAGGLSLRADITAFDADATRRQVRNLAAKSTAAKALIESNIDTIIDSGLVAHAYPDYIALGITQGEAQEWAKRTNAAFDAWAQSKKSVRNEQYNFYQLQRMLQLYNDRDGETFLNFSYSGRKDLLNPLQLTLIDPDQISGAGWVSMNAPRDYAGSGIERDSDGRESAYRVEYLDGLQLKSQRIPRESKSGRVFMTHGTASVEFAGQTRGVSPLGVTVQDLDNILTLSLSKIKRHIGLSQTSLVAYGEDPFPADSGEVRPVENAAESAPAVRRPSVERIEETVLDKPGGLIVIRKEGERLEPLNIQGGDEGLKSFIDTFFEYIAAARSTSPQIVKKDFNGSYHDQRATLILCYRVAMTRRYQLAADHLNTVYEMWLAEEIAAGRIRCTGWSDPRLKEAWARVRFVGTGIPITEPLREINTIKEYAALGLITVDDAAEMLGLSTDVMSNIERNKAVFEKLGYAPMPKGYSAPEEEKKEEGADGKKE